VMMWDAADAHRDPTLGSSPNALPSMEPENHEKRSGLFFPLPF
jgi:hypothetical protein